MGKENKYEVDLIRPEALKDKRSIKCGCCDLRYSIKDYELLFEAKKLIYFDIPFLTKKKRTSCHECLRKEMLKIGKGKTVIAYINDGMKKNKCKFYPSDSKE